MSVEPTSREVGVGEIDKRRREKKSPKLYPADRATWGDSAQNPL